MTPSKSMVAAIDHFYDLKREDRRKAFLIAWMYVSKLIGAAEYHRKMRGMAVPAKVKECRMWFTQHGYFPLNLRLFSCHVFGNTLSENAVKTARHKAGLCKSDWRMMNLVVTNSLRTKFRAMRNAKYGGKVPTVTAVQKNCALAVNGVHKVVAQIVNRRLRFVQTFNGVSTQDLFGDVMARLVQQFYWGFSVAVKSHATQFLVATATNTVRNLAHYYSAGCRKQATERDKDGISSLIVLNEASRRPTEDDAPCLLDMAEDTADTAPKLVARHDMVRLVFNHATSNKKTIFLMILAGQHNEQFDDWLRESRLLKAWECHSDLQDRVDAKRFVELVASFVSVTVAAARKFLNKIRESLIRCGYENVYAI